MFDSNTIRSGTDYTKPVALLALGIFFVPGALIFSGPIGYLSGSIAASCSALCIGLAWVSWKASSPMLIPSIETQRKPKS